MIKSTLCILGGEYILVGYIEKTILECTWNEQLLILGLFLM